MDEVISRRYAEALFAVVKAHDTVDATLTELATALQRLEEWNIETYFDHPSFRPEMRTALIETALADLSTPVRNCLRLMVDHHRSHAFPQVIDWFKDCIDLDRGIVRATATVPVDMSDQEIHQMEQEIAQPLGKEVVATIIVDPSLLGGAVIKIGDHVIDTSVKTRLQLLEQQLVSGA